MKTKKKNEVFLGCDLHHRRRFQGLVTLGRSQLWLTAHLSVLWESDEVRGVCIFTARSIGLQNGPATFFFFFIVSHLLQSAAGLLRRTLGQDNFSNPDRIAIPGIFFSESFSSSCFVKIASSLHCTHRDADTPEWQSLSPEFQMWRQAGGWPVASLLLPEMSKHIVSRRMKIPWRCFWTILVTDQYSFCILFFVI